MAKRVIVISKQMDIIRDDYNRLKEIMVTGENIVKKRPTQKTFGILKVEIDKTGILWFMSDDYTNLLEDSEYWLSLEPIKVFQFRFTEDDDHNGNVFKQVDEVVRVFNPDRYCTYAKFSFKDITKSVDKCLELMDEINSRYGNSRNKYLERIQIDFHNQSIPLTLKIDIASRISAHAAKMNLIVNSCGLAEFVTPNMWIGSDPCVSGGIMEKILGVRMVKAKENSLGDRQDCFCHKHIDLLGCGEEFIPGVSRLRKSDLTRGEKEKIDKISIKSEPKITEVKEKKSTGGKKPKDKLKDILDDIVL